MSGTALSAIWFRLRGGSIVAGLVGFAIVVSRGPADHFVYDAMVYWISSLALVSGDDVFSLGGLVLRGAVTPAIYAPAAIATSVIGDHAAAPAVLVQNATLIAVLGAVVIPALVRNFARMSQFGVYVSAVLTAVVLRGFGPYPLVDLWAVAFVLLALLAVGRIPKWYSFVVAGLLLGLAFNIRPAYLVPVILIVFVWIFYHRARALWVLPAGVLALLPQVVVNAVNTGSKVPWPVNSFVITEVQAKYAAFVVRYDTLGYVPDTQVPLFYCSPGMANRFIEGTPANNLELLGAYLKHFPGSLKFVAEKISASLIWTSQTPYSAEPSSELSALALAVVSVVATGLLALIWILVRWRKGSESRQIVPLLALVVGSVATLAFSTPEARFALPVVAVGLVGCVALVSRISQGFGVTRPAIFWGIAVLATTTTLVLVGQQGLANPAPAGDVTPVICASLTSG